MSSVFWLRCWSIDVFMTNSVSLKASTTFLVRQFGFVSTCVQTQRLKQVSQHVQP